MCLSCVVVLPASAADTKPPETRISFAPASAVKTIARLGEARFRFRGLEGAKRTQCRIDRGSWHRCLRTKRVWEGPGRHRIAVRAVDGAGNVDRSPAVRHWRVKRWQPNFKAARRYARRREGDVSFATDVGWREREFRGGVTAPTASTLKVMLMTAYLRQRGVRYRSLNGSDRSLLVPMIRRSDNDSASLVRNIVGEDGVRRVARLARMKDFEYSPIWGLCRTSARDQAAFMRNVERYIPRKHRTFAMRQLERITEYQRWGVGQVEHRGWHLYFKGGWGIKDGYNDGAVDHQVALLERGKWRIGLGILTQDNPSMAYGNQTLQGVAARLLRGLPD